MKRRISSFLTALLLTLSLCVPAMAETDYGLIYDETELLYSEDLAALGEHTLPELSEELGFEIRVDVLTGNSYESINAAAEGIYERFGYGYGSKSEGATLTVLMEPQDDGSYAMPERGGWCVYVSLSAERGSDQALTDALYAAAAPYMDDPSTWSGGDMDMASAALSWAVSDMAAAAADYLYDGNSDADDASWAGEPDPDEDPGMSNAYSPYVYDVAELLTLEEWQELETKAEMISLRHDCSVYAMLIDDYLDYSSGGDVYDTTTEIYHALKLGSGRSRNGIIILLSMDDRDYTMFVYGENAEYAFNKYGQEQLEDEFLGYFGNNDWYGGILHYLDACDEFLTRAEEGKPVRQNPLPIYLIVVAVSFVISLAVCLVLKWKMKTVRKKIEANEYVSAGGLHLTEQYDRYTHTTETRTKIHSDSDSGAGSSSCSGGGGSGRSGKF